MIPIDFVAGAHGNFLEATLNIFSGATPNVSETFTPLGTSHVNKTGAYQVDRLFYARHWFEHQEELNKFKKVISIRFSRDDLLTLSSVSLLRAADQNIDNDNLECNTVSKLNNYYYQSMLEEIYCAYPFLDKENDSIPRYVLREFFKFGFKNPDINGHWRKQQLMMYAPGTEVLYFNFKSFYNVDDYVANLRLVEDFAKIKLDFSSKFYHHHSKFLNFIPYCDHKEQCDKIIDCVSAGVDEVIPKLTLFQESYINGCLENIYHKEMPFRQDTFFTSTTDMLYYIENLAPNL